jgi:membrane-associated phospholipid phosphatase
VSGLGHPLLTVAAFVTFAAFRLLNPQAARWTTAGIIGLVLLPLAAWNYRQMRTGAYSNFDVSVREQRRSFYPLLLSLLGAATTLLFLAQVAVPFRYGMLVGWGLLAACFLVNFRLKVSLHAAMSFFMACTLLMLDARWGTVALGLASLVAASRLVLGRHSALELLVGAGLGILAGGGLWLVLR